MTPTFTVRLLQLLYIALLAVVGAIVIVCLLRLNSVVNARPRLESSGPIAEVLQWPWNDFPPLTETELREIAVGEELKKPMRMDLLFPYPIPAEGWPRPSSRTVLSEVSQGTELLSRLLVEAQEDPASVDSPDAVRRYIEAEAHFNNALRAQRNLWIALYNRAVLFAARENYAGSGADADQAARVLGDVTVRRGPNVLEAAVHISYLRGVIATKRGDFVTAIRQFRAAAQRTRSLVGPGVPRYAHVSNPLSFFPVDPTSLNTEALVNDLIAAYMADAEYHDCKERPTPIGASPCAATDLRRPCGYRDTNLCRSMDRSSTGDSLGQAYRKIFQEFYSGAESAWKIEHLIWALSNIIDRASYNPPDTSGPRLNFNVALVALAAGAPLVAAQALDRAEQEAAKETEAHPALPSSLTREELTRIGRLSARAKVVGRLAVRSGVPTGSQMRRSTIGRRFVELAASPRTSEGRTVLQARNDVVFFPDTAEDFAEAAYLDRWLFLRFWAALLDEGHFESFLLEYDALALDPPAGLADFFRNWRDEVLRRLGERALELGKQYASRNENDKAVFIREFLVTSHVFPEEVVREARGWWGIWWIARPYALRVLQMLLIAATIILLRVARAVPRTARELFESKHRSKRMATR